jgi:hypothetical protein
MAVFLDEDAFEPALKKVPVSFMSFHYCPVKIEPLVEVHREQTESVQVSV